MGAIPGSRASMEPVDGLHPSGFDPERNGASPYSFCWNDAGALEDRAVELVRSMAAVKCKNKYPNGVIGAEARAHYREARDIAALIEGAASIRKDWSMSPEDPIMRSGRCAGLGIAASVPLMFWPAAWPDLGKVPFAVFGLIAALLSIAWLFRPASAIEARSGETTQIGSTEGESAVAKPDAQGPAR